MRARSRAEAEALLAEGEALVDALLDAMRRSDIELAHRLAGEAAAWCDAAGASGALQPAAPSPPVTAGNTPLPERAARFLHRARLALRTADRGRRFLRTMRLGGARRPQGTAYGPDARATNDDAGSVFYTCDA